MATAKVSEPAPSGAPASRGTGLLDAAQRELDTLRASIDARLSDLESALSRPGSEPSLESLVLELARLATAEAQASATRACLEMQRDAEATLADVRARAAAELDAERAVAGELRRSLQQSQRRAETLETEMHMNLESGQDQGRQLVAERTARTELEKEVSRAEQQQADATRQLTESNRALAAERAQRTELREALTVAHAAVEDEQRNSATMRRTLAETDARAAEARSALAHAESVRDGLRARADAAERKLAQFEQAVSDLQTDRETLEADAAMLRGAAARAADEKAALIAKLDAAVSVRAMLETQLADVAPLRGAAALAAEEKAALIRKLDEAVSTRTALEMQLADLTPLRDAAVRAANEKAALVKALDEAVSMRATLEAQLADAAPLRGAVAHATEENAALAKKLDETVASRTTLETELADERRRAAALTSTEAELRASLNAAHADAVQVRTALARTQERLAAAELELQATGERHAQAADATHDTYRSKLQIAEQRVTELERAQTALAAEREAERIAQTALRQEASKATDLKATLARDLERATSAGATLDARLTEERARVAALVATEAELRRALGSAREDAATIRTSLEVVQRQASAAAAQSSGDATALADAKARLEQAERERDALKVELEAALAHAHQPGGGLPGGEPEDWSELNLEEVTTDTGATSDDGSEDEDADKPSKRYTFVRRINIKVENSSAVLVDLSLTGCRVRTPLQLRAEQAVRVSLPSEPNNIMCFGRVIWTKPDDSRSRSGGHVAGILFTHRAQAAIEEFIMVHGDL
jgi:chromosome segregation ATPase